MAERAFPIVYAARPEVTARFYESLGFVRHFVDPPEGEPGYIGLRRGVYEMAVVTTLWPRERYDLQVGEGVRFELFVYVDDVDAAVDIIRAEGGTVLREAEDLPWGERVGFVTDPDGNPVALAGPVPP